MGPSSPGPAGRESTPRPAGRSGHEPDDARRLWMEAIVAEYEGRRPTRDQQRAARRYERVLDERRRAELYAGLPKRLWLEWSGRPPQVVNRQADTYTAPLRGAAIDLAKLAKWLHDFLAEHAAALAMARREEGDALLVGPSSPAMERYRLARAQLAELELQERRGSLLSRAGAHRGMGRISHIIREALRALRRDFGREAAGIIEEALDDANAEINRAFGETEGDSPQRTQRARSAE